MCNIVESQTSSRSRSVRAKRRRIRTHEMPQGPALRLAALTRDVRLRYAVAVQTAAICPRPRLKLESPPSVFSVGTEDMGLRR